MSIVLLTFSVVLFLILSFVIIYLIVQLKDERLEPLLDIRIRGCIGTCSEFTATIYKNGGVHFFGERGSDIQGYKKFNLTPTQIYYLNNKIKELKVNDLYTSYSSNVIELPSTHLTFYMNDGKVKKIIVDRGKEPDNLQQFISDTNKIILLNSKKE